MISSNQKGRTVYEEGFNKMDAGVMASAGMWLGKRIILQAGYNYGLVDIDAAESKKARNGMAFLMLSFSLYSKTTYGPIIKIKPKG